MKFLTIEELNKMSKEELSLEWEEAFSSWAGVEDEDEEKKAFCKAYMELVKECYKAK